MKIRQAFSLRWWRWWLQRPFRLGDPALGPFVRSADGTLELSEERRENVRLCLKRWAAKEPHA